MTGNPEGGGKGQQGPQAVNNAAPAAHPLEQYSVQPKADEGAEKDSPYFRSAAPTITLPKGGGAIKGIDEKFEVNAVNGTAGLSVPLPLSPGRGGFTPQLSLSYNSGSGNSEVGLGWSLGIPFIQRSDNHRLPRYDDAHEGDTFLLAGAEDLVPEMEPDGDGKWKVKVRIPDDYPDYRVIRYRPRIEGLFSRIERISRAGEPGCWWRVTTRDNITTWYGLDAQGRIADPANAAGIYRWLPQLSTDGRGNIQLWSYKAEDQVNVPEDALYERNRSAGTYSNLYLERLRYCNLQPWYGHKIAPYGPALPPVVPTGGTPATEAVTFLMEALLDYNEDNAEPWDADSDTLNNDWSYRCDPFSEYRAGFEMRMRRKCHRVLMFHRFTELDGAELVRSLELAYQHDGATEGFLAEADYITSITQRGYSRLVVGTTVSWRSRPLPAMTMAYQSLAWDGTVRQVSPEDAVNAPQGLTGSYQWIDLHGEGLPGILTEQGERGWYYKQNLGEGHFTHASLVAPKPNFSGLGGGRLQWEDLDADGRRQVVSMAAEAPGYFQLADAPKKAFAGASAGTPSAVAARVPHAWSLDWEPFRTFRERSLIDWDSPYTKMLDLDGDGRTDALITKEQAWVWYKNAGKEGYRLGGYAPGMATDEEKGPRLVLNDAVQSIYLADMSGDGMTDLVRIRSGEVCYWPNLGWGRFGSKVSMAAPPQFDCADTFNPLYLTLADISGTGAADIVYLGKGTFRIWVNQGGNGFSEPRDIAVLPGMEPYSKVAVLDFLGNGTGCIVWSSPLPQYAGAPMRYVDLMGGVKPYLMLSHNNGMGKTVAVTYRSSTKYYLEDNLSGSPWATRLPFPVQCVSEVTHTDVVSETVYTQSYRYHHGYYDHPEREFRGFGMVETLDTDVAKFYEPGGAEEHDLDQPPVLTKTWYHTGAWMRQGTLLDAYKEEYYHFEGWSELPVQVTFENSSGWNARERREAYRALKGSALRQEVYAKDGSEQEGVPYTVTMSAYRVKLLEHSHRRKTSPAFGERDGATHAVFYTYSEQSLAWSCERQPEDARLAHTMTIDVDEVGNVLRQASVAYPRNPDFIPTDPDLAVVAAAQEKTHITGSVTAYTNDLEGDAFYRLRLPYDARSYELLGVDAPEGLLYTVAEMAAVLNGTTAVIDLNATPGVGAELRLLSCARTLYLADDAVTVVPFGTLGTDTTPGDPSTLASLALPYQQYGLAFTEDTTAYCYDGRVDGGMLSEGGYQHTLDTPFSMAAEPVSAGGCRWLPSGVATYPGSPAEAFYTAVLFTDPWGNGTVVDYWINAGGKKYWLLPRSVTAAAGAIDNVTEVDSYDWRHLQPVEIIDLNLNRSRVVFDALGMAVAVALMGKGSEGDYTEYTSGDPIDPESEAELGTPTVAGLQAQFWDDPQGTAPDLLGRASWRTVYDLSAAPVRVGMIGRELHWEDSGGHSSPLVMRMTYSDGFGRVAMMKAQAADDPDTSAERWIASGKKVYNNKGKAVLQYEPYFSGTWEYDPAQQAAEAEHGVSPRMYYDPVGRNYRTGLPDGTFSYTEWDNWSQTVYDGTDSLGHWTGAVGTSTFVSDSAWYDERIGGTYGNTAGEKLANQQAAEKAALLAGTPQVMYLDTLARPFYTVRHNRYIEVDPLTSAEDWVDDYIHDYSVQDVQGNTLAFHDGEGRDQLVYRYNYLKAGCQQISIDGGEGYSLTDAGGQPLYSWDASGYRSRITYDALRRPLEREVHNDSLGMGDAVLERTLYGEGQPFDQSNNVRGQIIEHYDGAGKKEVGKYDFKGLPLDPKQYLLSDGTLRDADWNSGPSLESSPYTSAMVMDALGRPIEVTDPGGHVTRNTYGKDGALKSVTLQKAGSGSPDIYVQDIHHNARGQREAIWYGNSTKTRYFYDALSYRLTRLRTINLAAAGEKVQDLKYAYDASGNATSIRDKAQNVVFYNNRAVDPDGHFTYDALYRLIKGEGRESIVGATFGNTDNTGDGQAMVAGTVPFDGSTSALQNYLQRYYYDRVGNITELRHLPTTAGGYTRSYGYESGTNRLEKTVISGNDPLIPDYLYQHDERGNMTWMPHLHIMDYDATNQMCRIMDKVSGTTMEAFYQYSGGERMRKVVQKSGGIVEERIYLGSLEVYRKTVGGSTTVERQTVHVADDAGRVAMLELLTYGSDGSDAELTRFVYSNHLGSATLELTWSGEIISYEEYHPYGTTAYQATNTAIAAVAKRYRYTGKERDEESGLNYHSARYYALWLCRWCASDKLERKFEGNSPYEYCFASPNRYNDLDGMQSRSSNFSSGVFEFGYSFVFGGNQERGAKFFGSYVGITSNNTIGFEGGVRIGLNIYSMYKNDSNIMEVTGAWYAGAVFGSVDQNIRKSVSKNEFAFAGSGHFARIQGGVWGIGGVGMLTSKYKGVDISSYMATQYLKGGFGDFNLTLNHTNDAMMVSDWLTKGLPPILGFLNRDEDRTTELSANLDIITNDFSAAMFGRVSLFTPRAAMRLNKEGELERDYVPTGKVITFRRHGKPVTLEQMRYVLDPKSHGTFFSFIQVGGAFQGSTSMNSSVDLELNYSFFNPQPPVQGDFAHRKGTKYPLFIPEGIANESKPSFGGSIGLRKFE